MKPAAFPASTTPGQTATPLPAAFKLPNDRWHPLEGLFWLAPLAAYFLFPGYLVLGSQVMIAGLFAISLDLILGYAGIVSLGHAAFFGLGAYTAGLLAVHGWTEPLTGLLIAAAAAGLFVDPPYGPVLANYGIDGLRFIKPVKPGDRIKVRLTCKEKSLRLGMGYGEVRWDTEITNQNGEAVANYDVLTMVSEHAIPDSVQA